ncbi:MAG: OmpA family protein [Gammaproteobacteria bacterium]|nr:OmpA family protein [Gammaproteobacteria bacterium]
MKTNRWLCGLAFSSLVLAGCAAAPERPQGADGVRQKLARLQSDEALANKAPDALERAEVAVRLAERELSDSAEDKALGAHRVFLADHLVEIAMAKSATRHAEDQRGQFAAERAEARLDSRTREVDRSKAAAEQARGDADRARSDSERMAREGALAREESSAAAARAAEDAAELQRQIEVLQAEATDRGLVLTLGDLLFAFDSADLRAGLTSNLDRLVTFLQEYPNRNAVIEGHTDNVGNAEYNRNLSQRRADSVRLYLVEQGVEPGRLSASGFGQSRPLADNNSDSGRERNRRVEIIIDNPAPAAVSQRVQ